MIKKFILLSFIILVASCKNEETKAGYVLTGSIDKSMDGKTIILRNADPKNITISDSSVVKDGKVTFSGSVDAPDIFILTIDGTPSGMPLILENKDMTIEFYKDSLQSSVVSGSHENDIFNQFKNISNPIRAKNQSMGQEFMAAQKAGDSLKMTAIQEKFKMLVDAANQENRDLIKKNNDVVTSAAILENMLMTKNIEPAEAKPLYDNFTESVKNSRIGKSINEMLSSAMATAIGSMAPEFTAPDPDGEMIALKDIRGKVTIIDFWAAWCAPCRRENPNVVKVYEKYHEKGLEIIGVSLDGTPRQKDAKGEWLAAIEKDGLTWHQVSNLQYFNDPVAKQYNIQSIPATYILDADGKIIAKNLRGSALEAKMAELLD
ncbi:TlpA disulfide reductase family protein [Bizionia sp. M204]|uniref:TlpA disulfide reductase family protein n=1 Tax=Bizionia sp. M204 TaxID=2675331 RepID=UPI00206CC264|nr:TlpA disulfide reductase family protein [Bizionia sp. M204]UPS90724.1 redoxin domain-containing protein [Bizionia sp. M204]